GLAAEEPVSPADFSLSVHNALAGLLSIATKNPAGHTAIAAGEDSFGFGLIEAVSTLMASPEEKVLLVFFDEPLPAEYATFRDRDETSLALALVLSPARGEASDIMVTMEGHERDPHPRASAAQALDFLRFLLAGEKEAISPGGRARWRWRRGSA
ncbi:MAG TPA: beta-ketoacyl synthase chain length factor, partial [Stellaceae bacterium]|nr:beta-ketoacyl synthase chain length factor [Stellaceae bacterium]